MFLFYLIFNSSTLLPFPFKHTNQDKVKNLDLISTKKNKLIKCHLLQKQKHLITIQRGKDKTTTFSRDVTLKMKCELFIHKDKKK